MERNFYNEEFEEFLKQKSDQYKMYPSDRVWNKVYKSIHRGRRWTAIGIILLFITGAGLVGREMLLNNYSNVAVQLDKSITLQTGISLSNHIKNQPDQLQDIVINNTLSKANVVHRKYSNGQQFSNIPAELIISDNSIVSKERNILAPVLSLPAAESIALQFNNSGTPTFIAKKNQLITITGKSLPISGRIKTVKVSEKKEENNPTLTIQNYNGSIGAGRVYKWSLQLYASPIVSYRRLSNLNNKPEGNVPVAINYAGNLDGYLHHKPAIGFEIGTKVQYEISKSLHLYAGAQLNYSRYYIDAYNYHAEKASIALNTPRAVDTVSNYTNIRNFDGYSPEQLQNQYFQLSVPLGAELKLLGNRRLQLSIAGAIQPTYLISSNSYLISSDYKNYIQNPDLARKFNVHTNFEAFVSYQLGGLKWQIGPQFRYQLFSSYSDKYPIREYLTEFGIKLGITKTIW